MFRILQKSFLFKNIDMDKIEEILSNIKFNKKTYLKGETIAFRGEKVESLMIVLEGLITTSMPNSDGDIVKIEDLEMGAIIAPAFIFGQKANFPVDLECNKKTVVLVIDKKELLYLFANHVDIMENYLNALSTKTQFLSEKIWFNVNNKSLSEKLMAFIEKNRVENQLKFKQSIKDMAASFGVARPSLSREIKKLLDDGFMERIDRNHYRILK